MAVGDTRGASVELRQVAPGDCEEVVDFDQLNDGEQRAFLRLYRGEAGRPDLPAGLVIRYTGYYRVEF